MYKSENKNPSVSLTRRMLSYCARRRVYPPIRKRDGISYFSIDIHYFYIHDLYIHFDDFDRDAKQSKESCCCFSWLIFLATSLSLFPYWVPGQLLLILVPNHPSPLSSCTEFPPNFPFFLSILKCNNKKKTIWVCTTNWAKYNLCLFSITPITHRQQQHT